MQCDIRFLEEYPTRANLEKQQLVDFPYKLVIAATSLDQFKEIRDLAVKTANGNLEDVCYWPVFDEVKEGEKPAFARNGYWPSPFAGLRKLIHLHKEVKDAEKEGIEVKVDVEYPLLNKWWIFDPGNAAYIIKRKILERIVSHSNVSTFESANYPDSIMEFLGMGFNPSKYKNKGRIKMLYRFNVPLARLNKPEVRKQVMKEGVKKLKNRFAVAFGCIANGVFNNEPIISPSDLEEDVKTARNYGIEKIAIFRLGGLTKNYAKAIKVGLNLS